MAKRINRKIALWLGAWKWAWPTNFHCFVYAES